MNSNEARAITRHVDSTEADGVDKNITTITLRERDHLSSDYCDLLVTGLNRIEISWKSLDNTSAYQLRAITIA